MRDCPVIGGLADGQKRDHLTETEHRQSNWKYREGANMGCKQLKRLLSIADWSILPSEMSIIREHRPFFLPKAKSQEMSYVQHFSVRLLLSEAEEI
jgi:hypothetical protein